MWAMEILLCEKSLENHHFSPQLTICVPVHYSECYQHYTQRFWIRLKTEEKYEIVLDKEATKKLES